MKHVFYFLAILPLCWELATLFAPKKVLSFYKEYVKTPKEKRSNLQKGYTMFLALYLIWMLVGLLTFQWIIFLLLIKTYYLRNKWLYIGLISRITTPYLILFTIVNAYYLKIDFFELILSLF